VASEVDPGSPELSIQPFCVSSGQCEYCTRTRSVSMCVGIASHRERRGAGRAGRTAKVQLLLKCRGLAKGMDVWMWARSNGQRSAPLFFSK